MCKVSRLVFEFTQKTITEYVAKSVWKSIKDKLVKNHFSIWWLKMKWLNSFYFQSWLTSDSTLSAIENRGLISRISRVPIVLYWFETVFSFDATYSYLQIFEFTVNFERPLNDFLRLCDKSFTFFYSRYLLNIIIKLSFLLNLGIYGSYQLNLCLH